MKRNKLVSIAAITVALGVLATGCAGGSGSSKSDSKSSGGTKTVTVKAGTGANVKPYTYVGDDNETTGYDVEVLKEVFDRLDGYDLQIEVTDIPSVFSGVTSGTYQIGVNNFSYNEERAKSYLYSYPYDKIGYVFITKKGAPEVKTFADAAGKSFEGQSGVSVTTAIESWNEKNPDKKIDITYTDADTAITLQHIEDGTTDLARTTPGRSRKIQTSLGTGMPVGAQKYYREKITGTGGCDQCRKSRPKASECIKKRLGIYPG